MSYFKAKMHQIRFRLGLCPRTHWGAYRAPPDSLAGFKGPTSKRREGKGKEGRPVFSVQLLFNTLLQRYFAIQATTTL